MPPHHAVLPLYTTDRPEMDELVAELRAVLDEFDDRLLIGEIYLPLERLMRYYGHDLKGAHLPFNFSLLGASWDAAHIAKVIREYEAALPPGGWPNWVLGNHDYPRIASRTGRDQARLAAMLLLTLRGTPTMYYGDEIGMAQVAIPPERVRDPFQKNVPGLAVGRDGSRTPMQWDGTSNAGFSQTEPWLPVAEDFAAINVATQREQPTSIYNLYRGLIALRNSSSALMTGSYRPLASQGDALIFARECAEERVLVALNLGNAPAVVSMEDAAGVILVSSHLDRRGERVGARIELRPNEGLVIGSHEFRKR
jgi:alpha-glucosidase